MLNSIINYSLRNRLMIVCLSVLLFVSGVYTATRMEVDVFPDLNAPTVVVLTEAPGLAPEEVERLVSFRIETAVNGAAGIRRIRSSSSMGFSIVWVEFEWGVDIYNARQTVSEKLIALGDQLPDNVSEPMLAPQSSILGEIMLVALTADSTSAMDLRTIADWNIRPRLLAVGGVAQVTTIGGDLKQYQILLNPEKMKYYNISLNEVKTAVNRSNDNASGGFVNEYGNEYLIRAVARTTDTTELGNTVVKMNGDTPIKLIDLARVAQMPAPQIGTAAYNGKGAIIITITKQPNVNTIELTDKIKATLAEMKATLPDDLEIHQDIFEQAKFIETSINNVERALIEGGVLVVIILVVFLLNIRTTMITLLAIPLSLLVAMIAMYFSGFSINTMSLGGMAIAIGSLVDDAIIDVENVYKQLKQNTILPLEERQNSLTVVFEASKEIRSSILNATMIIIVAFVPLFFLTGMEGLMLRPLGFAYIIALAASLFVAITITPVLSSYLLTNEKRLIKFKDGSFLERFLNAAYSKSLTKILNYKRTVVFTCVGLFVVSVIALTMFGRNFLPPFNEGSLTINTSTMPGISLMESDRLAKLADSVLMSIDEIESVARRTGRAELAEHAFGGNTSEIDAPYTITKRSREEFLTEVRKKLNTIGGFTVEVGQPISHRIDAMLSGSKANIAIKLFGDNLNVMYETAENIKKTISTVEGIADLNVEQQIEIPQIQIKPKREMLAKYGIAIPDFLDFVKIAFAGEKVGDVFENENSFDMVLRFDESYRNSLETIENAMIDTHKGTKIPLYYVAEIKSVSGPNTISRENAKRVLTISVNVAERDVRGVVNEIKNTIGEKISLPENYYIHYGGQFESEEKASRTLLITSLLSIFVIFLFLYQEFKNTKLAVIILLNLPLALIGGVLAIQITSATLSIPAIIGFITLFGIATRNGILLVSRYETLIERFKKNANSSSKEHEKIRETYQTITEMVIKGSVERLTPILMTALTAAFALLPLALAGDKPGNEIQSPMAIVILGGLLSSTLLNIYVVPIVYSYYFEKKYKLKCK